MGNITRRTVLIGAGAAAGAVGAASLYSSIVPFGTNFPPLDTAADSLILNDASELEPTRVAKHLILKDKPDEALYAALRSELVAAQNAGQPVVAHAARHSMGGQSLAKNGLALSLDQNWIEPNIANSTYRCGAGTRWSP